MKFNEDLKYGKIGEGVILELIKKKNPDAILENGYQKGYDIYIPKKDLKIEVKTDRKSRHTNNIAVECSYKGMPSGIQTTQSKYWVVIFHDETWKYGVIESKKLYDLCQNISPIKAGDGAMCHLVPKDTFKHTCRAVQGL
jgi:hypothetical protein